MVAELLKKGFKLQGGMAVAQSSPSNLYCVQVIVREVPTGGKRKTRGNKRKTRCN